LHCQVKHFVFRSRVNFHPKKEIPPPNNFPMGVTFEFSWGKKKCEKIVSKTIYFEQFKKSLGRDKCCFYKLETGSREKRGPGLMVTSTGDDTS